MLYRWRRGRGEGMVGIEASAAGIAIAQIVTDANGARRLRCCDFVSREAIGSDAETLTQRIAALGLSRAPCNWVLPNLQYSLLLVEAPQVPIEELREAMRWRIKDLIAFPAEEATLDVFPLPEDGMRGGHRMVYVVVTQTQQVRDIIDLARTANVNLRSIDIGELALRNIAEILSAENRGVALVRLRQGIGSLALVRQEKLYLSRQFELAYNAGLLDDLPADSLVLELQRSLDYYERQMGQVPPAQIVFCGENVNDDKLGDSIKSSLSASARCLNFAEHLAGADQWDQAVLNLCAGAIGGALRREAA